MPLGSLAYGDFAVLNVAVKLLWKLGFSIFVEKSYSHLSNVLLDLALGLICNNTSQVLPTLGT